MTILLIFVVGFSLKPIVVLSSSLSTPLVLNLVKMIAISCIPNAENFIQRGLQDWPRQMIMNKFEL